MCSSDLPRFLLDTDHLTWYGVHHPVLEPRIDAQLPGDVVISAVTIGEVLRGRMAEVARHHRGGPDLVRAYEHLVDSITLFHSFKVVPFDAQAEAEFQQLVSARLRIGTMDLRIAGIALAHGLIVLTCNRSDFGLIPGLTIDDWAV